MKKVFGFLFLLMVLFGNIAFADVYVNGYYRKDGTYVKPHYRSSPNGTKADNWSTYGNTNPYTGEAGTKKYDDYSNSYDKQPYDSYKKYNNSYNYGY